MKRQQDTVRCCKCGGQGHNSGTCNERPDNVDVSTADKENGKNGRKSGDAEISEKPVRAKRKKKDKQPEPRMEPPNLVQNRLVDEEDDDIEEILTQQNQLTQEVNPYLAAPIPTLQGPTMYQQLHMGMQTAPPVAPHHQPAHQVPPPQMPSRVNIRARPPFTSAQFHFRAPAPKMPETGKTLLLIVVVRNLWICQTKLDHQV